MRTRAQLLCAAARVACYTLSALAAGCGPPIRLQPGLAAVRVHVTAEPKTGASADSADASYWPAEVIAESGAYEPVEYGRLDQIAVWVDTATAPEPAIQPQPLTVEIGGAKKRTPLFVTGIGGSLVVSNRDARPHRPYSVSDGNTFSLGVLEQGQTASRVLTAAGEIELLCDDSREPSARIVVAPTRWARVVRSGESVVFTDLPPGPAIVKCWHARLPASEARIDLKPDQVAIARLRVTVNLLPKAP